jgi:hypothetical protein
VIVVVKEFFYPLNDDRYVKKPNPVRRRELLTGLNIFGLCPVLKSVGD